MSARLSSTTTPNGRSLAGSIEHLADNAEKAVHQMRERVEPNAVRWAEQAEELAHRGIDAMRGSSERLRTSALTVTDRGVQYVQQEPVKAILIAAAAGALLVALLAPRSSRKPQY